MNFYPHHIGDYARDTQHLSPLEDGCYRRMLDIAYASEKPLPASVEAICRLVRAKSASERKAVDAVLGEFWKQQEDGWHNKRVEEEILKAKAKADAARVNGQKGGRPKTQQEPTGFALGNPAETQGKAPNNQEPEANSQRPASAGSGLPACPHEQILALYHEILPECPRVMEWNDRRQTLMRTRWREKSKPNGRSQGYTTPEAGLAYWRRFFTFVSQSKFLTGKVNPQPGRPPFVASLEWLITPSHFAKVVEGEYHREAQ